MFVLLICLSLVSSSYATVTTTTSAFTTTLDGTTTTGATTTVESTTTTGGTTTTGETTTSDGMTTSSVATTTSQSTTTVATGACVDKIPVTDAHNCAYYAGLNLCNNAIYYDLMGQQCPATCNRCAPVVPTVPPPAGCADKTNPKTGVSDCPSRAYLCTNQVYYSLMTEQCPVTCNRCSTSPSPSAPTCVDKVNPSTGVSDCPRQASLCNDANYYSLMTTQCPKTCNRCSVTGTGTGTTTCVDKTAADGTSNCAQMKSYCNNATYKSLMSQQCAKTCGLC